MNLAETAPTQPLPPLQAPLSAAEFARLAMLTAKLPRAWIITGRRRRFLFLGLAAPGFLAVFATPLHRNLALLVVGFVLFAAACAFRTRSERLFVRAEAAALWPPAPPLSPREDHPHA